MRINCHRVAIATLIPLTGLLGACAPSASTPPPETSPVIVNVSETADEVEGPQKQAKRPPKKKTKQDPEQERAERIAKALAELDVVTIGKIGGGGGTATGILGGSEVPAELLGPAAAQGSTGSRSGSPPPAAGGGGGLLRTGRGPGTVGGGAGGGAAPPAVDGIVELGPTTENGGDVANADRVMARLQARFRRCYRAALRRDPSEAGSLVLEIDVGANGKVTASRGAVRRGISLDLEQCVEDEANRGTFSPPTGGSSTLATQLTFKLAP